MAAQKKRSAAQKAATARMLAANRAKKTATKTKARRTPARKATTTVVVRQAAPAPARRRPLVRARKAAETGLHIGKELLDTVAIPAAVGAGSASLVDVVYGYVRKMLPGKIGDGMARHAIKAGAGIGLAMLAQKAGVPAKHARAAAIGVCTVAAHRLITEQVEKKVKVNLNGLAMTMGELAAVIPDDEELNGLEALGALAAGDSELGAVIPFMNEYAA